MDIVLVDTSVWINFFKDTGTLAARYLEDQIHNVMLATCPTIVQEVLQGVLNDKDYEELKSYFNDLLLLENNSYPLALEASQLYRALRKKGITIRKPNDCLIAVYAIRNNIALLHDDRDFVNIALHSDLKIIEF
ncbi:putative nucleic acid-binding protein [Mucilaginibacter sp. UYNi724]